MSGAGGGVAAVVGASAAGLGAGSGGASWGRAALSVGLGGRGGVCGTGVDAGGEKVGVSAGLAYTGGSTAKSAWQERTRSTI